MSKKLRVGIIGTGQIGKQHVKRYSELADDVEMVGLCDIRMDEVTRVAQQYKVDYVTPDYHELLKRDDIDAIDVCLHNFLHMPVTVDALEAGKHVFCEKPMSWTYPYAKKMYDKAKEVGKKLNVQIATIFSPETRGAERLMAEGALGDIYYVKCTTYRRRNRPFVDGYGAKEFVNTATSGGGSLIDMGIYSLGRMFYLLKTPEILTVSGSAFQKTGMYEDRSQTSKFNVEELGVAHVRLAGGITLLLETSWAIHGGSPDSDSLFGTKGGLKLEPFTYYTTVGDMEMDGSFDLETADWRWHQCMPITEAYDNPQKHWAWALLGRVELIDTAWCALRAAQLAEGVYLSNQLGREVTLAEIEAAPVGAGRPIP
jgi:predicted dehydrogenase